MGSLALGLGFWGLGFRGFWFMGSVRGGCRNLCTSRQHFFCLWTGAAALVSAWSFLNGVARLQILGGLGEAVAVGG